MHDYTVAWYQVLASLDKAFSKLGFVHADMRISNVMEHHLDAEPMYPKGFTSRKQRKQAVGVLTEPKTNTFKIPGRHLHALQPIHSSCSTFSSTPVQACVSAHQTVMLVSQMTLLITNRGLHAYWPAQELLLVPALYTPDGFSVLHIAGVCPMVYRSEVLETPLLESKTLLMQQLLTWAYLKEAPQTAGLSAGCCQVTGLVMPAVVQQLTPRPA